MSNPSVYADQTGAPPSVALLNPPMEAAVCQKMIFIVKASLELLEESLVRNVLDREQYLQKIGAANELRSALMELEREYARNFEV